MAVATEAPDPMEIRGALAEAVALLVEARAEAVDRIESGDGDWHLIGLIDSFMERHGYRA